jgi:ferredoxin-NADP reductase
MEGTAVPGRLTWQVATVTAARWETPSVRTIELDVPSWPGHRAGQHLDVKLTAEDGYSAERSYSIASAAAEQVAIAVERLDDGEVSPYLTDELRVGDELELRGPVGGYFVWEKGDGGPLMLVGGGSGIVPLRAILRERERTGSDVPVRLLYSARTCADLIYRDELAAHRDGVEVFYSLTREQPAGWAGYTRRVDPGLLAETAWPEGRNPLAFVCGPTSFVEIAADGLVALGYQAGRVKTERFGGTGGAARLPPSRRAGRRSPSGRPCKAGPAGRRLQGGLGRSAVSLRIPRDRTSPDAGGRSHEEEQARCR